jgi:hypothetical protein
VTIRIREHRPGRDLDAFLSLPEQLYAGDPGFVAPLLMEQRERLTPTKNPFFEHAEATLFTAYKDGKLVGRISAQVDREHLKRYNDDCGFFGFFDTINDVRVGRALLDAAATWLKAHEELLLMPEVRIRTARKSHLAEDVNVIVDVFNDAWSDNYHFVPMTQKEVAKMASDMKLLLNEQMALIAEIDGKPAAIALALPNLNEAIHDLDGKLFPFGLAKLIYRIKIKRPKSARLILLGIKNEYRHKKRYGGLSTALYVEVATRGRAQGYEWGELGWTLEDNRAVNLGIKMMGGELYKRHRIYEKALSE